jgi:hypothetical protein
VALGRTEIDLDDVTLFDYHFSSPSGSPQSISSCFASLR